MSKRGELFIKIVKNPPKGMWPELVMRPAHRFSRVEEIVRPILDKVKRNGDRALRKFIWEYDHVRIDRILVSKSELVSAGKQVPEKLKKAIGVARKNIEKFHRPQLAKDIQIETTPGVICHRKSVPIQRIGFYVPGGTAPLFSTVLMLGIPAKIAGCEDIILCTPTNSEGKINPIILYTAHLLGIKKVAKVGGAQAIAAMTYGTESIPAVDKIFGPGNQYVTVAKQLVSREKVAIDMPAGPSEVLVLADDKAVPSFVAADLLSQAEHGIDSQVVLVAFSEKFISKVIEELKQQLKKLPRKNLAEKALSASLLIKMNDLDEAIEFVNLYSPEHLIIAMRRASKVASQITNAGSVFIGDFTPESAGDYASGTNHTLPTNGWARSMAGVSVDSFVKKITFQEISAKGIRKLGPVIEEMAAAEQLDAHKNAVSLRLNYLEDNDKA